MSRDIFSFVLAAMRFALGVTSGLIFALVAPTHAQQSSKIHRIGYLSRDIHPSDARAAAPRNLDAFREGLRELGYIEGKNIYIEYRYADGRLERMPALAQELVRAAVDIIVGDSLSSVNAARNATKTIPIVMTSVADPITAGLVSSFARPGGNVTGITDYTPELLGKRVELLRDVVPKVFRFAFLNDVNSTVGKPMFKDGYVAARTLGIDLKLIEVKTPNPELEAAFRLMTKERIGALITGSGRLNSSLHRNKLLELVANHRLPAIYPTETWVEAGGLMYYGASDPELYRRAASYVDRILKGAKAADLPVEQPAKFELVVNLKAARQIELSISPSVLARADRVIK